MQVERQLGAGNHRWGELQSEKRAKEELSNWGDPGKHGRANKADLEQK